MGLGGVMQKPKLIRTTEYPLSLSTEEIKRLGGLLPPNGRMAVEIKLQENQLRIIKMREDPDIEADTNVDVIILGVNSLFRAAYAPPMDAATQIRAHEQTIRDLKAQLERSKRAAARVPEAPPSVKAETSTAEEEPLGRRLAVAEENIAAAMTHLRGLGWDIPDGCNIADAAEIVAQRIEWQRAAWEDEVHRLESTPSEMEAANELVSSVGLYPAGADRAECLRDLQHRFQRLREENERLRADLTAHGEAADVEEGDENPAPRKNDPAKEQTERDRAVRELQEENERLRADLTAHGEAADVEAHDQLQSRVCSLQAQIGDRDREIGDLTVQRDKAAQAYQRAMDGHRLIRLASDSALAGE